MTLATPGRERIMLEIGKPVKKIFENLFPDLPDTDRDQISDSILGLLCARIDRGEGEYYPEVRATVDKIRAAGGEILVASNGRRPYIEAILRQLGTPCLIHQPIYSMFRRWVEDGLLDVLQEEGIGCIAFSPLAQGLLTDKYLSGIPEGSRASKAHGFLRPADITEEKLAKVRLLNELAKERGQTLAQMALAWVLRQPAMTSVLIGASKIAQIEDAVGALQNLAFPAEELQRIESILSQPGSDD